MSTDLAKREFEAYRKDDAEARAILDKAAEENRSTSPEEDERFDKLVASAELHKKRADDLARMDAEGADLAERIRARIGDTADPGSGAPDGGHERLDDRITAAVGNVQERIRADKGAFEIVLEHDFDEAEIRAIANFSDAASLYTSDFSTRVAVYQRTMSPWVARAQVINSTNGRPLVIPNLTADPTGYTPGEGTAITPADPTLGSGTAVPAGYKALSYVSAEAEEDEMIGLLQVIARAQGRQLGLDFGSALTTAVLAAAQNAGTAAGVGGNGTATVTFIGYEDLLDLKYSRAAPYRLVGEWFMSNGLIKKARKWKDGEGQYLWQPSIALGQPDTFDGQPVWEDPFLAAPASATKSAVYGDPASVIVKQMPLRVAVSTEYKFAEDQVAIKSVYRAGGVVADAPGLAYIVSKSS